MATGQQLRDDRAFVEGQGYTVSELGKDRARATWYRPDGKALPNLPVDPYHRALYRAKGWTLKPPESPVKAQEKAIGAGEFSPAAAMILAPSEQPKRTVVAPPKHIHVMQPEMGSPCLVQGCSVVRINPPGKTRRKAR